MSKGKLHFVNAVLFYIVVTVTGAIKRKDYGPPSMSSHNPEDHSYSPTDPEVATMSLPKHQK